MKKKALLLSIAALGLFAVASCGDNTNTGSGSGNPNTGNPNTSNPSTSNPTGTTGPGDIVSDWLEDYTKPNLGGNTVNVYLNYKGQSGVTFTGKATKLGGTTYENPVTKKTYQKGDLLPLWDAIATNLNCKVHDSVWDIDEYVSNDDAKQKTSLSEYPNFADLDMVMMNNSNANTFSSQGKLLDLTKYLDYMPNYKYFLEQNPTVKKEMTNSDGEMFMLPYFDGINTAEHMFIMNTELVEKLLDEDSASYDTAAVSNGGVYQASLDTSNDYKVLVSRNGKAEGITIKGSKNPITRQNELPSKTGATYAQALKDHIDAAYGAHIGSGKLFSKRSEVFTSESACYNSDDLIALMRVAVNNSKLLGYEGNVEGFIPREHKDSRIDSVLWLMQIFGVQGVRGTAEKDALYFDKDGELQDGRVQAASYDALEKLHQLYQEGLIVKAFDDGDKTSYTSTYLKGKGAAALLMFDYNTTQTANNKKDANGNGAADSAFNGIMPILPPLTKWENDDITDSQYAYSRYIESSRANKGSGTVIPKKSDDAANIRACQFADYFFSKEGAYLQDYCTETYQSAEKSVINGIEYPQYKSEIINAAVSTALGWNDYCRSVLGTTQGIGHVRTPGCEYQFMHVSGRKGQVNLESAIASGAVIVARTNRAAGFGATVPSQWSSNPDATKMALITPLEDFWKRGTGDSQWRSIVLHGWEGQSNITRAALENLFTTSDENYLEHYRTLLAIAG